MCISVWGTKRLFSHCVWSVDSNHIELHVNLGQTAKYEQGTVYSKWAILLI